jgi:Protein of unknown function (DUF2950)
MKLTQVLNWHPPVSALVAATCLFAAVTPLQAADEERFDSTNDAIKAFTAAVVNKDTNALEVIFGPSVRELVSADPVQASNGLVNFSRRVSEKVAPVGESDSSVVVQLGWDAWPFPVPLVKQDGKWFFDTDAGKDEILNRRIGRNELNTISVCRAYVEAQHDYASECRTGEGVLEYAQHLRSTSGQKDGLYWHAEPGEEISPFGPLIAEARGEGYTHDSKILTEKQEPYQGYFFKILTRQGRNAAGGKYNYIINGHMIAGFALVAWPAEWGNSGVMTFIINQQGKVFEKNLGPKTSAIASAMTTFDPGPGWKPALE